MFQSSLIHSFWAILTRKSMWCFILCNPPWHIFLSGFHSSSPVCQAASQHLRPRVHGHRVWVRGLRVTSSHCQMGQEWRCCHPQRLLQNNCMFIRNTCLSQPFSSWEWLKMLLVTLLTAGFTLPSCSVEGAQPAGSGSRQVRWGFLPVPCGKRCWQHPVQCPAHHLRSRYATHQQHPLICKLDMLAN